jgi:hypothetical protein
MKPSRQRKPTSGTVEIGRVTIRAGDFIVLPHRHQFSLPEYYETDFP